MKFLLDMNISPRWTSFLEREGFSAQHWVQIGPEDARDADIMAVAEREDYIIITQDLDFTAIHAHIHKIKPSVILLRSDNIMPETIGRKVVQAIRQMQEPLAGALLTIDATHSRLRVLPL